MARPPEATSTSKRQLITLDVGDGEENERRRALNDGKTLHLGRDLPDVAVSSESSQTSDSEAFEEHASMGANNSREEINDALHATSQKLLRGGDNGKLAAGGVSDGRLRKIPRRGATDSATTGPILLSHKANARPSIWDVGNSPEKAPLRMTRQTTLQPAFSPVRAQRKQGQHASSPAGRAQKFHAKYQEQIDNQLESPATHQQAQTTGPHRSERQPGPQEHERENQRPAITDEGQSRPLPLAQDEATMRARSAQSTNPHWSAEEDAVILEHDKLGTKTPQILKEMSPTDRTASAVRNRKRHLRISRCRINNAHSRDGAAQDAIEDFRVQELSQESEMNMHTQAALQTDRIDADAPLHQEQAADGGAADEEGGNVVVAAAADSETPNEDVYLVRPQPRKRGRPRKNQSQQQEHAGNDGKVRKSARIISTQPIASRAASNEATDNLQPRQTRTQQAASKLPEKPKPQPTPTNVSAGTQSTVQDLRRQTNAEPDVEAVDGPERDVDEGTFQQGGEVQDDDSRDGSFEPEDDDDADNDELPEDPVEMPQMDKVRPSEMYSRDEKSSEDEHELESQDEPRTQRNKRKRRAPGSTAEANTGRKRARFGQPEPAHDEDDLSIADAEKFERRLFGQYIPLREVYGSVKLVGCNVRHGEVLAQNEIELEDDDVRATVKLCKKAIKLFDKIKDRDEQDGSVQDPVSLLDKLGERIDGLRGLNEDFPTDFHDKTKSTNIYFHVIPKLVELVRHAIEYYEITDKDEAPEGQIEIDHLRLITGLIELILDLEKTAAKRYERPDPDDHVVQPVHNGIAIPLHSIRSAFAIQIQKSDNRIVQRKRNEDDERARALENEQKKRRARDLAQIREDREKWEKLHEVRKLVEGGFVRPDKVKHLQIPSPESYFEVDSNGAHFERTEVFHPRIGPPPGMVDEIVKFPWSMVELSALHDGLKKYAGDNVFVKIFRAYCGRGGELNKYNVTEIVVTAAGLRDSIINQLKDQPGGVEEWVTRIPVWTKGHQALGKENENEVEGLVDLTEP